MSDSTTPLLDGLYLVSTTDGYILEPAKVAEQEGHYAIVTAAPSSTVCLVFALHGMDTDDVQVPLKLWTLRHIPGRGYGVIIAGMTLDLSDEGPEGDHLVVQNLTPPGRVEGCTCPPPEGGPMPNDDGGPCSIIQIKHHPPYGPQDGNTLYTYVHYVVIASCCSSL